jgi:hypothetical protein
MIFFKVLIKKFVKDGTSQFQNFHVNFDKFQTVLYEIITVRIGYHRFSATWVLKMLMGGHKMLRMASPLTFLEQYHKDGN